jgi:chorismate synthase
MRSETGEIFRVTTFGESHGPAIGGVIDGMPAGVRIDVAQVQRQLDRRRPGQSSITTQRDEKDLVEILSGLFDGVTLGTPIGFIIRNTDHRSADYSEIAQCYRPSHADYTYSAKYGIRDYRGGGRASARETAARVVAGAFAAQALARLGITVTAYTSQIAGVALDRDYRKYDLNSVESNIVRCPDADKANAMIAAITDARNAGDTLGGVVTCVIKGVPAGLGEPVFGKLQASLGAAMLGINAVKGFEYGLGFDFVNHRGSEVLDNFVNKDGKISTATNYSGGIQGGISNGEDIYFNVAFKPVATLMRDVDTVDIDGNPAVLHPHGRHDQCVVPRAVPIVEAMAAIVILDNYLINKTVCL